MKYRKKPLIIEAHQWFINGDHPQDECWMVQPTSGGEPFKSEGKIVRYFRHPDIPGSQLCPQCKFSMHVHGWIDTLEGDHRVCPGDFIITGIQGEYYPCKPDIFLASYDEVVE